MADAALRLGTKDPILFFHAGMIAQANKDFTKARDFLTRALELNPEFSPLHAEEARRVLSNVN
jgi:hypothetical protein